MGALRGGVGRSFQGALPPPTKCSRSTAASALVHSVDRRNPPPPTSCRQAPTSADKRRQAQTSADKRRHAQTRADKSRPGSLRDQGGGYFPALAISKKQLLRQFCSRACPDESNGLIWRQKIFLGKIHPRARLPARPPARLPASLSARLSANLSARLPARLSDDATAHPWGRRHTASPYSPPPLLRGPVCVTRSRKIEKYPHPDLSIGHI